MVLILILLMVAGSGAGTAVHSQPLSTPPAGALSSAETAAALALPKEASMTFEKREEEVG